MQILFPSFGQEVLDVLNINNIRYCIDGNAILFPDQGLKMILVPMLASSPGTSASTSSAGISASISSPGTSAQDSHAGTFFLYEDRWRASKNVTAQRILSRLGVFRRVHARLCTVVSLQNCKDNGLSPDAFRSKAKKFLDAFHTYGYLKGQIDYLLMYKADTIAAAQFMKTYSKEETAYEWTRYASLPDVRIAGGMGKVLEQFIRDVIHRQDLQKKSDSPKCIEVMSYSDNEWGEGDAYRKLGFRQKGSIPPVTYRIDPATYKRINPRQWAQMTLKASLRATSRVNAESYPLIQNQGSRKWVLRLSDGCSG
jgi:hypothetical protein